LEFKLEFTNVKCKKCGEAKAISSHCPSCGDKDVQLDTFVLNREKAVLGILENLIVEPNEQLEIDFTFVLSLINEYLNEFMSTIKAYVNNSKNEDQLIVSLNKLILLHRTAKKISKLRPYTNFWRSVESIVFKMVLMAGEYISSLYVFTPDGITKHSEKAQYNLDCMTKELKRISNYSEWIQNIEDTPLEEGEIYVGLAENTFLALQDEATNIEEIIVEIYHFVTGRYIVPEELKSGLLMTYIQVEMFMDSLRFWRVVKRIYELCNSKQENFSSLMDVWLDDYKKVANELYTIGIENTAITSTFGQNKNINLRAQISLTSKITERISPLLLAFIYSMMKNKKYTSIKSKDAGYIRNLVNGAGLEDLTYGFDFAIRDADAHDKYYYDENEDIVYFYSSRREYDELTYELLFDRAIGALESAIAIHTGVTLFAIDTGFNVIKLDPLEYIPIPREKKLHIVLSSIGLTDIELSYKNDRVLLNAKMGTSVEMEQKNLHTIAIIISQLFSVDYKHAQITIKKGKKIYNAKGQLETIAKWVGTVDGFEKDYLFAKVMETWSFYS